MTSFKKSLSRLKEICAELRGIDQAQNRKLSAARFKAEAAERASAPMEELLKRWEKADELRHAQTAFRTLVRWIVGGRAGEMNLTRTPPTAAHLNGMIGSDQAIAEAASVNLTAWDIWTLAVHEAAETKPDCFGPVDDPDDYAAKVHVLETEFSDLCAALDSAWTAKDIEYEPVGHNLIKARFKCAPVYLQEDDGRRLGMHIRQHG